MVRKGSMVVLGLGVLLLLFIYLVIIYGINGDEWILFYSWATSIAALCFWWPLVSRPEVPAPGCVKWLIGGVGILCLLLMTALCMLYALIPLLWPFVPVLGVQLLFGIYVLRRPRLLLPWSIAVPTLVILTPFLFRLGEWPEDRPGAFMVLLFGIPFMLVNGVLLALPFAWLWVWLAERAQARKQDIG